MTANKFVNVCMTLLQNEIRKYLFSFSRYLEKNVKYSKIKQFIKNLTMTSSWRHFNFHFYNVPVCVHAKFQPNRMCTSVDIGLLKNAPLMWRHVTHDNVIMKSMSGTNLQLVLCVCAKCKVDLIDKSARICY